MSSNIKQAFISRFDGGYLLEADFGQLEVYALAYLSKDKQLMKDLEDGLDLHCVNAAALANQPYSVFKSRVDSGDVLALGQRKLAKTMSFQLQYGAGPVKIAKENGCTEDFARKFIRLYYERYSGVKCYHDGLLAYVPTTRRPSDRRTSSGLPAGIAALQSDTGRVYTFFEEDSFKGVSFSPTQIKNYPVQGFATGDIVPLVLGHLHNKILSIDNLCNEILLINTIHDSILEDVSGHFVHEAAKITKETMEYAPQLLKEYFGIEFEMKLKAEVKVGKTWATMENYDESRNY